MITSSTQVTFTGPDITLDRFVAILCPRSKLTVQEAGDCFKAAQDCRVSPLFFLGFFFHESQFGAIGVCHDYQTHSPGNTRSSRIGVREFVTVPGKGQYIKYDNWRMGAMDACYRLVDPAFTYVKAGAKTIGQILPIWAPGSDNNDPVVYINSVVNLMSKWIGEGKGVTMFDLNNIPFKQSPNCDKGGNSMKRVVIHSTEGSYGSSVGWLLSPAAQASAHYVINEDGSDCTQLVHDEDIAWHAGNYAYNQMCIGIEHSWFSDGRNGPPPDSLYQAGAKLAAFLCKKHGIIPNRGNIIAHGEIPPPNDHTDPGPNWNWSKFMAYVVHYFNGTSAGGVNVTTTGTGNSSTPPNIPPGMIALDDPNNLGIYTDAFKDPVTGFQVIQPFCVYYRDNGGLAVFGHPTSGLYGATPGGQDQTFEYGRLWWDKASGKVMAELKDHNNPKGFDVGVGVMSTLKAEGMVAVSSEQFFTANSGQVLGQRSFTYAQDKTGATYQVQAIEDIDGNGKKIGTWSRQIWQFVKEVK